MLTSPPAPAVVPVPAASVTVIATPAASNATEAVPRTVVVQLQPPAGVPVAVTTLTARFTVTPATLHANVDLRFDATASTTPTGTAITTYAWSFGDGVTDVTTTPTTSHVYTEARVYPVTLTVTNNLASSAQTAQTLTVVP
jgi:PKD repeat protein